MLMLPQVRAHYPTSLYRPQMPPPKGNSRRTVQFFRQRLVSVDFDNAQRGKGTSCRPHPFLGTCVRAPKKWDCADIF